MSEAAPTISVAPTSSRHTASPAPSTPAPPAGSPSATADQVILDAVSAVAAAESFRFRMRLEIAEASANPFVQRADGQTETGEPRRSRFRVSGEDGIGFADTIHDTDAIYLRGPGFENQTGPGKWLLLDLESDDPRMAEPIRIFAHTLDPRRSIYLLFGATRVESAGMERIDGRDTSAFTLTIDLRRALAQAPDEVAAILETQLLELQAAGLDEDALDVRCDVRIDADGLLRRMEYTVDSGDAAARRSTTSIDLFGFGEPVELGVPEPDDTVLYGTPID